MGYLNNDPIVIESIYKHKHNIRNAIKEFFKQNGSEKIEEQTMGCLNNDPITIHSIHEHKHNIRQIIKNNSLSKRVSKKLGKNYRVPQQ
jgi:hypothetical protein